MSTTAIRIRALYATNSQCAMFNPEKHLVVTIMAVCFAIDDQDDKMEQCFQLVSRNDDFDHYVKVVRWLKRTYPDYSTQELWENILREHIVKNVFRNANLYIPLNALHNLIGQFATQTQNVDRAKQYVKWGDEVGLSFGVPIYTSPEGLYSVIFIGGRDKAFYRALNDLSTVSSKWADHVGMGSPFLATLCDPDADDLVDEEGGGGGGGAKEKDANEACIKEQVNLPLTLSQTFSAHFSSRLVELSPNGQIFVSAAGPNLYLRTIDGKGIKWIHGHTKCITCVVWSPDGHTFASASDDKTIKIWSKNGALIKTLEGHTYSVSCIAWSPDGSALVSGSIDKTVKIWRKNGMLIKTLEGHTARVDCIVWNPQGFMFASGSWDKTIRLWSAGGNLIEVIVNRARLGRNITWSPDGKTLVSALDDETIRLWDTRGKVTDTWSDPVGSDWVSWHPSGHVMASAGSNSVQLWSRRGELIQTLNQKSSHITWSSDGATLAIVSISGAVQFWNYSSKPEAGPVLVDNSKDEEGGGAKEVDSEEKPTISLLAVDDYDEYSGIKEVDNDPDPFLPILALHKYMALPDKTTSGARRILVALATFMWNMLAEQTQETLTHAVTTFERAIAYASVSDNPVSQASLDLAAKLPYGGIIFLLESDLEETKLSGLVTEFENLFLVIHNEINTYTSPKVYCDNCMNYFHNKFKPMLASMALGCYA